MANMLKQTTEEIMRQSLRDKDIILHSGVAEEVSEIMEGVTLDRAGLQSGLTQILQGTKGNPLNAILNLIGFKLVSTSIARRELDELLEDAMVETEDASKLLSFIRLDEGTIREAADRLARTLGALEKDWAREQQEQREQIFQLQAELDNARQQMEAEKAQEERRRVMVAEQVQYMLSVHGRDGELTCLLTELLEDLECAVCWEAGEDTPSEAAMFSTLKCDAPESRKMKPCVLSGDKVLVKGLKFRAS